MRRKINWRFSQLIAVAVNASLIKKKLSISSLIRSQLMRISGRSRPSLQHQTSEQRRARGGKGTRSRRSSARGDRREEPSKETRRRSRGTSS